jgi:hypothetical protein
MLRSQSSNFAARVINAALEVHRQIGPGRPASIYGQFLAARLTEYRLTVESADSIPVPTGWRTPSQLSVPSTVVRTNASRGTEVPPVSL